AFARLFLDAVGNDDAAGRLFLGFEAANEHAIVQRTKCHGYDLSLMMNPDWHSHQESASGGHMWMPRAGVKRSLGRIFRPAASRAVRAAPSARSAAPRPR